MQRQDIIAQNPTLDMVLKIASALGKTVSLSLEDQEEMKKNTSDGWSAV